MWWVNQGKTWAAEHAGGYLFAPVRNAKTGREIVHWKSMADVRVGDRIIHFANGRVRAVSVVAAEAVIADRPAELGERWEPEGYLVRATYTELSPHVSLSSIPVEVRRAAPRDRPFDVNGKVKEGYLWPVSDALATELARANPAIGEQLGTATGLAPRVATPEISSESLIGITNWRKEELQNRLSRRRPRRYSTRTIARAAPPPASPMFKRFGSFSPANARFVVSFVAGGRVGLGRGRSRSSST